MIRVEEKQEPSCFDQSVRQKGLAWLKSKKLPVSGLLPNRIQSPAYWRDVLGHLHTCYNGVCAYYSFYVHKAGGVTTDHFVPKTNEIALIYEWSNYRLSCFTANNLKRDYTDVLDPFSVLPETFRLNLVNGEISVNREARFSETYIALADATIKRLKLNSQDTVKMRFEYIQAYIDGQFTSAHLLRLNPFVHAEMQRQGKLK